MRTRRLLGATALTAAVVVGLTGCMKIDMALTLNSDNTVDGTMIMAVSKDLASMMGQSPEDISESMAAEITPGPDEQGDFSHKPYDDGEFVGTEVTITGSALDSFTSTDGEETGDIQIVRDGDEFVVTGVMDLTEGAVGSGEDLGMGALGDSFEGRVAITFPGKVTEHDGELSGTTVTWVPKFGESTPINARGSAVEGGGELPIALIAGIGAAVLLLIGLVLFFVLRGRKSAAPAVAAGYPTAGYAGYAPTGTPGETYAPAGTPDQGYAPAPPAAAPPAPGYVPPVEATPYSAPPAPSAPVEPPPAPPAAAAPPAPPADEHPREQPPTP